MMRKGGLTMHVRICIAIQCIGEMLCNAHVCMYNSQFLQTTIKLLTLLSHPQYTVLKVGEKVGMRLM